MKPAIFDLFLALGIASYLGVFYLALVVSEFLFLKLSVVYHHSMLDALQACGRFSWYDRHAERTENAILSKLFLIKKVTEIFFIVFGTELLHFNRNSAKTSIEFKA